MLWWRTLTLTTWNFIMFTQVIIQKHLYIMPPSKCSHGSCQRGIRQTCMPSSILLLNWMSKCGFLRASCSAIFTRIRPAPVLWSTKILRKVSHVHTRLHGMACIGVACATQSRSPCCMLVNFCKLLLDGTSYCPADDSIIIVIRVSHQITWHRSIMLSAVLRLIV